MQRWFFIFSIVFLWFFDVFLRFSMVFLCFSKVFYGFSMVLLRFSRVLSPWLCFLCDSWQFLALLLSEA